jgi:hypothetical protein
MGELAVCSLFEYVDALRRRLPQLFDLWLTTSLRKRGAAAFFAYKKS